MYLNRSIISDDCSMIKSLYFVYKRRDEKRPSDSKLNLKFLQLNGMSPTAEKTSKPQNQIVEGANELDTTTNIYNTITPIGVDDIVAVNEMQMDNVLEEMITDKDDLTQSIQKSNSKRNIVRYF